MTIQLNKGDVCSLEVVIYDERLSGDFGVFLRDAAGLEHTLVIALGSLTLIRRAPVDLATCEIGDGIAVRHREHAEYHGIMLNRVKHGVRLFAFVDWDSGEPDTCLVSDLEPLRPLDAPAPESEAERLRADYTNLRKAAEHVMDQRQGASVPPVRDEVECGRMLMVRVSALADLHDALAVTTPTCPPCHIMIGDRAVPEPMRVAPAIGDLYWVAFPTYAPFAVRRTWTAVSYEQMQLQRGLIHSTEANARAHAEAIIALSAGEGV